MNFKMNCGCQFKIDEESIKKFGKSIEWYKENGKRPPVLVDWHNLPDCKLVWEMLAEGRTKGVFQLESNLGRTYSKKLKPESIEHLSALSSILRPGSLEDRDENGVSTTDHYCLRKNGLEPVTYPHESLKQILERTYGIAIYQENSLEIAKKIAGFSLGEADTLRKCVTGDTRLVSKKRGWISIDELLKTGYENELFLTMDEKGHQKWEEIDKIWLTGRQDVSTVETRSGFKIKTTKYHQFHTNNGWKARLRLKIKEDYATTARIVDYDGEDKISLDLAMVIAGIICEGYFVEKGGTFVNYDKKMMDLFINHFTKVFNREKSNINEKVFTLHKEEREYLNKYIEYGLSVIKKIPDVMMGMTKETTKEFLSFMLGCEGGITKSTGQFEFSSKSEEIIDQIKLLLLRFGIYSIKCCKNNPNYGIFYRLYINERKYQKIMLDLLSHNWPDYKINDLKTIIENKTIEPQFTTDIIPTNIMQKLINQYPKIFNYKSGRFHKNNVSRKNFIKFSKESKDKKWIRYSKGLYRFDLIDNIEKKKPKWKQVKVYDFSMKNTNRPFIIANGMLIHNSIGKKIPELMSKCRNMFIEGAKKTNIIDENAAKVIFDSIEKSQRYQFNLSHSFSYAINSYRSAYFKIHFPTEFFCSYLRNANEKQKPYEEIAELVNEAKIFGINIVCPDIRALRKHFHLVDEKTIRYGIIDVKGIGESHFHKLQELEKLSVSLYGKRLGELTWNQFLPISLNLNKTTVENLIQSGALACYESTN